MAKTGARARVRRWRRPRRGSHERQQRAHGTQSTTTDRSDAEKRRGWQRGLARQAGPWPKEQSGAAMEAGRKPAHCSLAAALPDWTVVSAGSWAEVLRSEEAEEETPRRQNVLWLSVCREEERPCRRHRRRQALLCCC